MALAVADLLDDPHDAHLADGFEHAAQVERVGLRIVLERDMQLQRPLGVLGREGRMDGGGALVAEEDGCVGARHARRRRSDARSEGALRRERRDDESALLVLGLIGLLALLLLRLFLAFFLAFFLSFLQLHLVRILDAEV